LRQHENELHRLNIRVCGLTFEALWLARAYVEETGMTWPLLIDESRQLYEAYGMFKGRVWDLFGPAAVGAYLKLMSQGKMPRRPTGDVTQLGGDVLIDPNSIVRYHHVGSGPADRPSVSALLAEVHGA
jgi:hypothetical protein